MDNLKTLHNLFIISSIGFLLLVILQYNGNFILFLLIEFFILLVLILILVVTIVQKKNKNNFFNFKCTVFQFIIILILPFIHYSISNEYFKKTTIEAYLGYPCIGGGVKLYLYKDNSYKLMYSSIFGVSSKICRDKYYYNNYTLFLKELDTTIYNLSKFYITKEIDEDILKPILNNEINDNQYDWFYISKN